MRRVNWGAALLAFGTFVTPAVGWGDDKSSKDSESGWVSLFDGKTLGGWTTADGTTGRWKVEDGAITCSGPASHLFSPRGDYQNFRYRAEIKINDKGNSGMYFRTAKGPGFPRGYEAQVNSTHGDPVKTGSLYNHVAVKEILVPPEPGSPRRSRRSATTSSSRSTARPTVTITDPTNAFTEGHFAFQHHDPSCKVAIRKIEVIEK